MEAFGSNFNVDAGVLEAVTLSTAQSQGVTVVAGWDRGPSQVLLAAAGSLSRPLGLAIVHLFVQGRS